MAASKRQKKLSLADLPYVGRGTAAGDWFRRHWLVVGTSSELRDIPQAVKVLGEELVLFRDDRGRIGLLGLQCPHRGTSLEYGDIEDGGIRCPYHGWLFDVGRPMFGDAGGTGGARLCQEGSPFVLPVRGAGRLALRLSGSGRDIHRHCRVTCPWSARRVNAPSKRRRLYNYNWFNFIENGADPAHFSILHRADPNDGTWRSWFFNFHDIPPFDAVEMPYGMKVISRKPGPTVG